MIIKFRTAWILSFLLVILFVNTSFGQATWGEIKCICIDAGHGGKDPGAIGAKTYEKHLALSVALKVGKLIKQTYPNVKVVYTRDKDVFIGLKERSAFANKHNADLFISIHANAVDLNDPKRPNNKYVSGIETFVLGTNSSKHNLEVAMRENAAIHYEDDYSEKYEKFDPKDPISYIIFSMLQSKHLDQSLMLASSVQKSLIGSTKRKDRDVKQMPFWVLKDVAMPSILIEMGFISNLDEERYMMSSAGQTKIIQGIFKGFESYKTSVEKDVVKSKNVVDIEKDVVKSKNVVDIEKGTVISKVDMDAPLYAVQISSATTKVKGYSKLYTRQKVNEIYTGGRYRYYVAASSDLDKVQKDVKGVRTKIKDCFIIAIYKGNLISITEAKKLEQK